VFDGKAVGGAVTEVKRGDEGLVGRVWRSGGTDAGEGRGCGAGGG
jgi:hypothetical protein